MGTSELARAEVDARNAETSRQQVAALETDQITVGYTSADDREITTWTGEHMMAVVSLHRSRAAHKTYVTARDVNGRQWRGVGPDESGTYVTMRRSATK